MCVITNKMELTVPDSSNISEFELKYKEYKHLIDTVRQNISAAPNVTQEKLKGVRDHNLDLKREKEKLIEERETYKLTIRQREPEVQKIETLITNAKDYINSKKECIASLKKEVETGEAEKNKNDEVIIKKWTATVTAISWYKLFLNCHIKLNENNLDVVTFAFENRSSSKKPAQVTLQGCKMKKWSVLKMEPEGAMEGTKLQRPPLRDCADVTNYLQKLRKRFKQLGVI